MKLLRAGTVAWVVALSVRVSIAAPVTSPDDVCAPADDPCVISSTVEVDSLYPLDFGLRTVRIAPSGKLVGTVSLSGGAFEADVGPTAVWMDLTAPVGTPRATVTARRACSGDLVTPCLVDTTCGDLALGTCSIGDGGMRISGELAGKNSPSVDLRAAGDIAVQGKIAAKGSKTRTGGGSVDVQSTGGSIELTAVIDALPAYDDDYGEPGFGGSVVLRAASDVTVDEPLYASGGGSYVSVIATSGDVTIGAGVFAQTLAGSDATAGTIRLTAGGRVDVVADPQGGALTLDVRGNSRWGSYGLYGGPGGYAFFNAGSDITISPNVRLQGDSGSSKGKYVDDLPWGACWYFYAGGAVSVDAPITARGKSNHGYGCTISLEADEGIRIGRKSVLVTTGMGAADITLRALGRSPVTLDGKLDARGRQRVYYGSFYGNGGSVYVYGGDVAINGRAMTGGGDGARGMYFDACRLRMGKKGRIDGAKSRQYSSPAYTEIRIGESMITERGSKILAKPYGSHTIWYRDAAKPPVLGGSVKPAPTLIVDPFLAGCPVCGNAEIDAGETCDDGNAVPGDGCSELCQTE